MQSGHIFEENEAFNWSQKCRFFRVNFFSSQREIEEIQASQNATKRKFLYYLKDQVNVVKILRQFINFFWLEPTKTASTQPFSKTKLARF
jgi:hypothetical protein